MNSRIRSIEKRANGLRQLAEISEKCNCERCLVVAFFAAVDAEVLVMSAATRRAGKENL